MVSPDNKNVKKVDILDFDFNDGRIKINIPELKFSSVIFVESRPVCGNGICEEGETFKNCSEDCRDCSQSASVHVTLDKGTYHLGETRLPFQN